MPPKRVKKVMTLPINVIFSHLQVCGSLASDVRVAPATIRRTSTSNLNKILLFCRKKVECACGYTKIHGSKSKGRLSALMSI